ncbi:MAG: 2-hydroxyacid dehydrogenase [Verrucomicrobia bacterium]|nr:2-hydroxyacid dehydrogenase [Verrucomicrobiota bacterium]
MKPEILMVAPMTPKFVAELERGYVVHRLWEAPDQDAFLKKVGPNIKAMTTNGALGASGSLIDALPNLEIIVCYGVGVDAIDLPLARKRGIPVTTTPNVLTEDVADMALALLLATARQIVLGDHYVRTGQWATGEMALTRRVNGKRIGIFGLGRVGKALAKRLEALNMKISYTGRKESDVPYMFYTKLVTMAADVDFLVVTAAGGEATRKAVDRPVLEALGAKGILINVSRGSIVDEEALVQVLKEGKLGGAGLDVFATEPNVPQELRSMPNVVLQPHHASGTIEARSAMGDLLLQNLEAHFAGKPLLTPFKY